MSDRVFGGTVALLALLFLLLALPTISEEWRTDVGAQYFTIGPRLFPTIAGVLCLLFGLMIALRPTGQHNLEALRSAAPRRHVLSLAGLSLAYVLVLPYLGFVLASFLVLVITLPLFGARRWYIVVAVAVLTPVLIQQIFYRGFMLMLPRGILGMPF